MKYSDDEVNRIIEHCIGLTCLVVVGIALSILLGVFYGFWLPTAILGFVGFMLVMEFVFDDEEEGGEENVR